MVLRFKAIRKIPFSIWILGLVSLFTDISTELIRSILPIYMVSTLGASMLSIGIVEGIVGATVLISKVFSGFFSDYIRNRKALVLVGYCISALSKLLLPLVKTLNLLLFTQLMDRFGKGVREAPRDALMADLSPKEIIGLCFGVRQALDTVGAFLGPMFATLLLLLWSDKLRMILWLAFVPAAISVILLIFGVKEKVPQQSMHPSSLLKFTDLAALDRDFWKFIMIVAVLMLARFSDAFLVLNARSLGISIAFIPTIFIWMNIVYAISAVVSGVLSDSIDRRYVLMLGISFLSAADFVFAFMNNIYGLFIGISLWGLHMGFTESTLLAVITEITKKEMRGTTFGIYSFICGVSVLLASIIAGYVWDSYGSKTMFLIGFGLSGLALLCISTRSRYSQ